MRIRPVLLGVVVAACQANAKPADVAQAMEQAKVQTVPMPMFGASAELATGAPVEAPWTLTATDGSGLMVTRVDAKAVVQGPLAFTELHLWFHNTEARVREGTFAITLPPGAAVSRFAMENNGQWMEAEMVEKQLARRAYEDFLHRRQDPALLEKAAGNQFTARVFPIPASGDKHLVISFSQELPGARYTLPLRGLPKVERIDVALESLGANGPQKLSQRNWQPDRDFVSSAPASVEALTAGTLVAAQLAIGDASTAKDVPRSMTILVDTSASRALGFDRYARSVRDLVKTLATKYGAQLPIDVIAFDQDTQAIFSGRASEFGDSQVKALHDRGAAGASDLGQALRALGAGHERVVVITDGVVTAGASAKDLPGAVKQLAGKQVQRLDVVLAGGIRDGELAGSLVHAGLPHAGAVLDLDVGLDDVADGLGKPVLVDVPVSVAGATWVYPRVIPSARAGSRVMVYARLAKPAQTVQVSIGGKTRAVGLAGGTPALVERAAATAEIAELEARLDAANGDARTALRAEIAKKAIAARVVSSQTSMLVLESDGDYARYGIDRKALADILVVGPRGLEQQHRTLVLAVTPTTKPTTPATKSATSKDYKKEKLDLSENVAGKALEQRAGEDMGDRNAEAGDDYDGDAAMDEKPTEARSAMDAPRPPPPPPAPPPGAYRAAGPSGSASSHGGVAGGQASGALRDLAPASPSPSRTQPAPARMRRPAPESEIAADRDDDGVPDQDDRGEAWPPPGSPKPLTGTLAEIEGALHAGNATAALAKARAWHEREPGDVLALIGLGDALEAKQDTRAAARIYGSIIDLFPGRADLRRFAGERLERIGAQARSLAVDTYSKAVEERPDHLTGHRLLAYALLRDGKLAEAFAAILAGLDQQYPDDRFRGGERVLTEDAGLIGAAYLAAQPGKRKEVEAELAKRHASLPSGPSTRFILYWETDANDVDFHIQDARGGHAFYSRPRLASGGELYADITTGYGPECFAIPGTPKAGPYKLSINYYSQGPMGYGMGLLQIVKYDGKGGLHFEDRPYVIMADHAYVDLGKS